MSCQLGAAWTLRGVKLKEATQFLVTEDVEYGPDGSTVFQSGQGPHVTRFEFDYDYNVIQIEISTLLKD